MCRHNLCVLWEPLAESKVLGYGLAMCWSRVLQLYKMQYWRTLFPLLEAGGDSMYVGQNEAEVLHPRMQPGQ